MAEPQPETILDRLESWAEGELERDAIQSEPPIVRANGHGSAPRQRLAPVELSAFLGLELPAPEPVVGGLLRGGSLGLVHSKAGVGKTWLLLAVGVGTSHGVSVLGFQISEPRPVLYIDGEMLATDMQRRLAEIVKPIHATIEHAWKPFHLVTPDLQEGGIPKIDTAEGQAEVLRLVDDLRPALVIFDNLSCLTNPEDDNSAGSWSMVQELLLALRRRGIAVLVGHHSGKSGEQRGTSRRADILDVVLKLVPACDESDGHTRLTVEFEKGRGLTAEQKRPFAACLEAHPGGGLMWSRSDATQPVIDRVRQMLADGMSPGEIATEAKVNRSYCYRIRNEMLAGGELAASTPRRAVSPGSPLGGAKETTPARLRRQKSETNGRHEETAR